MWRAPVITFINIVFSFWWVIKLTFEGGRGLGNIISNGRVDNAAVERSIGYLAVMSCRDNGLEALGNGKCTLHFRSTCMIVAKDNRSDIVALIYSFWHKRNASRVRAGLSCWLRHALLATTDETILRAALQMVAKHKWKALYWSRNVRFWMTLMS